MKFSYSSSRVAFRVACALSLLAAASFTACDSDDGGVVNPPSNADSGADASSTKCTSGSVCGRAEAGAATMCRCTQGSKVGMPCYDDVFKQGDSTQKACSEVCLECL